MTPFVHELRVRYGECDPQGIVFNANYLMYADVAYTELFRAAIGPWDALVARGLDAVVAEARLRFRAPARFDDVLALRCSISRLGGTSITTAIDIARDGTPLVAVTMRHVMVDRTTWAKTEIPDWVRSRLAPYVAPGAQPSQPLGDAA